MESKSREGGLRTIVRLAEFVGIPALVSAIVSTGTASYFESRLENSKDHIAAIIKEKEGFDDSQVSIFSQLGIYTNLVMDNEKKVSKEDLYSAIVSAQLHLSRLKLQIDAGSDGAISKYSEELENLRSKLKEVKSVNELKPVYVSAQKILELHDEVTNEVRAKLKVSIF